MPDRDDRTVLDRFRGYVTMGGSAPQILVDALKDLEHHYWSFDLRWEADMRAIKRWQAAGPDRELTWPDHADLVVWLLEQRGAGDWRPIAEAPIPPDEGLSPYWSYSCLIQSETGAVFAGFVRYVEQTARGRAPRVLRWYEGVPQRYAIVPNPKYFMPLPAKRED